MNTDRCRDVFLGDDPDTLAVCQKATLRAIEAWREEGIEESFIKHVVNHIFPGIPPKHAGKEALERIRRLSTERLGVPVVQVDGLREDGLINVLTE